MIKYALLLLALYVGGFTQTHSQAIKMKIPSIAGSAAAGEAILAFEVSDTTFASLTGGGGSGVGKTVFELAKVKKQNSGSTNELWKRSLTGVHIPEVQFEFYDNSNTIFYKVVLKDVTVNHFSFLAPECKNCISLFHQVWFDYGIIQVTDMATGNVVTFNRATNLQN